MFAKGLRRIWNTGHTPEVKDPALAKRGLERGTLKGWRGGGFRFPELENRQLWVSQPLSLADYLGRIILMGSRRAGGFGGG